MNDCTGTFHFHVEVFLSTLVVYCMYSCIVWYSIVVLCFIILCVFSDLYVVSNEYDRHEGLFFVFFIRCDGGMYECIGV